MTEYCLAAPNDCLWLNIQTGEKTHAFPTIEAAMDFYFQRISANIAIPMHDWWLQLTVKLSDNSPLTRLLSKTPPPHFQQATDFQYIPVANLFNSKGIESQLWKYAHHNGIERALFTSDYILGYEIKSEKNTHIKTYVTREYALKAVREMPHDPEVTSYAIQEWTMQIKKGLACTSEEVIPKKIVITI